MGAAIDCILLVIAGAGRKRNQTRVGYRPFLGVNARKNNVTRVGRGDADRMNPAGACIIALNRAYRRAAR